MFLEITAVLVLLTFYLWNANRSISSTPASVLRLCQKPWTMTQMKWAYDKAGNDPINIRPYLFSTKKRRYIVIGGSKGVGKTIVQHLLLRGENPVAIRVLDSVGTQPVTNRNITYQSPDITRLEQLESSFDVPWSGEVANLPLTVFHTYSFNKPHQRNSDYLKPYLRINLQGVKNTLNLAKRHGASIFIHTSSSSVGIRPPSFFPSVLDRKSESTTQYCPNADPAVLDASLNEYANCHAWSLAKAESFVRRQDCGTLRTGSIRPGHIMYNTGSEPDLLYDLLQHNGGSTWLSEIAVHLVDVRNASIGHLALEDALAAGKHVGGRPYCVTDPNPSIRYSDLYRFLTDFAKKSTMNRLRKVPGILTLLMAYCIEAYELARERYLDSLPVMKKDWKGLQPAVFQTNTVHYLLEDKKAQEDLGYVAPIRTIDGIAEGILKWNLTNQDDSKPKQ